MYRVVLTVERRELEAREDCTCNLSDVELSSDVIDLVPGELAEIIVLGLKVSFDSRIYHDSKI